MSLDTQVALARPPPRGESSHLSRAARQVVPPFLQKLYEIVNDAANEELIKWSENGDSFYVLNHEKFAREVLGRWFKHQKFASFVRQLNMYGFHKIPHLQQGVLKSDTDTEPWHFEHPNFHRGQPDLLCLIQRKKQPTHGQPDDPAMDIADPAVHNASPLANVSPGHLMDINSIVNGVSAIKRHQQAISADLSVLKQSNDALWKEAVAARQRHAKHQDTINRILKFLAGVFGHTDNPNHSSDDSHSPPQVTPRIRQRLMIGDGRSTTKGKHVDIMEVEDHEAEGRKTFSSDRYATIETPGTSVSSPSIVESATPGEPFSLAMDIAADRSQSPPIRPAQILSRTSSGTSTPLLTNGSANGTPVQAQSANNTQANGQGVDAMLQAAIQHMMTSPGQFQRLMQAFAGVPSLNQDNVSPHPGASAIQAYDPNQQDYTRWFNAPNGPIPPAPTSVSPSILAPVHHDDSAPLQLLLDDQQRLQKSYRDAAEIDADMDMLQSSINSLIQNLGIDPTSIAPPPPEEPISPTSATAPNHTGSVGGSGSVNGHVNGFPAPLPPDSFSSGLSGMHGLADAPDAAQPDYLLDSLLSQIGDGHGVAGVPHMLDGYSDITDHYDHNTRIDGTSIEDASTEQLTAFLDEAASAETTPVIAAARSPKVSPINGAAATHQKRKSDVAELSLAVPPEGGGGTGRKAKRKR